MKFVRGFVMLLALAKLMAQTDREQFRPHIGRIAVTDLGAVAVTLHLRPGYVSAIRLPEAVNSIAVGDPSSFRAEHSDAEPELVFFKPLTGEAARSNALIATRSGGQISVSLISAGTASGSPEVDFLIDCRAPSRLLLVAESPVVGVAETSSLSSSSAEVHEAATPDLENILNWQSAAAFPDRSRREIDAVIGRSLLRGQEMVVSFSVLNRSHSPIELLPPQIELSNTNRHGGGDLTSEPLPVSAYRMTARILQAGERADGVLAFERPTFKESRAALELRLAQSQQVDHPIILPLPFLPETSKEMR